MFDFQKGNRGCWLLGAPLSLCSPAVRNTPFAQHLNPSFKTDSIQSQAAIGRAVEIYNSLQTYSLLSRADGRERPLPSFHPRRTILIPRHSSSLKRILIAIATELEGSRVTGKDRLATSVSQTSTSQTLSGKLLQRGILHFQGVSFKAITLWASVKHLGTALSTIEAIFASAIVFCQRFIERQREDLYFCIEIFSGRGHISPRQRINCKQACFSAAHSSIHTCKPKQSGSTSSFPPKMATESDDLYLDLSYMDENGDAQNGNTTSQYAAQDESTDLYGDEAYEHSTTADNSAQDVDSKPKADTPNVNGDGSDQKDASYVAPSETDQPVKQEQGTAEEPSSSRKRKDRDEDEYSQTLSQGHSQTPRPASTTPMPQQGYGQAATNALNIQQLTHNTNEEILREWANAVGREGDIVELKFDEFKPNGKSKGACFMKFRSADAAKDVKDHIATLPKPPGQRSGYLAHYTVTNPYHRTKDAYGANNGNQRNNQNRPQYQNQQGGYHQNRGNYNRGGGYQNFNNRGNLNQNNWQQNRNVSGGMAMGGFNGQTGFQPNQGVGFNNMAGNNFRGGMMNNRGGRAGVMPGGMNSMMGRGGMQGAAATGMGNMNMGRGMTGAAGMMGGMPNMMGGMMPGMMGAMPNMMGGGMPNMMGGGGMMGGMRGGMMGAGMQNMMGGMGRGGFQANQMGRGGGVGGQMGGAGAMKKARYN